MTDGSQSVLDELRGRLRAMVPEELVELCAQLLATYVIEGVVPLARAAESTDLAGDGAGEESFAQLLRRLKAAKKDPVLERFIIDGENISVRIDGQGILPITEYRRPVAPARATASPQPAPPAPAPPKAAAQPAQPAGQKKPDEPKNDRFSLIELE